MNARRRIFTGLALAVAVGLFGPTLAAVATHTGNGNSAIRGRVTNIVGDPLEGICVTAYHRSYGPWDLATPDLFLPAAGTTNTLADGTYAIPRLTNDAWRVKFEECLIAPQDRTYRTEWYNDKPTPANAQLVETRYGYDKYNINAVLSTLLP